MNRIAGVIALALAASTSCASSHTNADLSQPPGAANADKPDDTLANPQRSAPAHTTPSAPTKTKVAAQMPEPADSDTGCVDLCVTDPAETCYRLVVHGATDSVDDSSYVVPPGEAYVRFYYDAPWETGALGTRYDTIFDNQSVLHDWQLFATQSTHAAGYSEVVSSPAFNDESTALLAAWAVGGPGVHMPDDAGLELPAKGTKLSVQWHYDNSTATELDDRSGVQLCTVPAGGRAHIASVSVTGTEDLGGTLWNGGPGMPAHQMSSFQGTCDPLRTGVSASEPIHILGFWPTMRRLGVQMDAIVHHQDGTAETILSKPFDYNAQIGYLQSYDLAPGDTLTTQCDYDNTSDVGVPFGDTVDTESCYDLVIAWPAHALESATPSVLRGPSTCL